MFYPLLSRFFYAILTLFGVVSIVFFLFNVLPGDPAQMMLDQKEDSAQMELVKKKFGFDLPVAKQYFLYLNDLSIISYHSSEKEDFSYFLDKKYTGFKILDNSIFSIAIKAPYLRSSYQKRGKNVSSIIFETLPNTIILALSSIFIAIFLGIIFGVIATLNKDTWIDRWLQLISTLGMSVPSFFSAIIFSWLFGFVLNRLTHLNMTGSLFELDDFGEERHLMLKNLILPAFVLGIRPLAVIIQLVRGSLLEVLSQDYIRTAKSKGLSRFNVVFNHGIKNALNPVVTVVSGWFASLLSGAVFVEYIFGWKGLGKEIVTALNTLDIPVIIGAVLTISTLFIIINILVDLIYIKLDPQVKLN